MSNVFMFFHSFNITETIAAISASLEESNMQETCISNRQEDLQSDEKLLEATKQQSMQEMVSCYTVSQVTLPKLHCQK